MKERIKKIKQKFKDILIEEQKEHYNDTDTYIKTVDKSYLVFELTYDHGLTKEVFREYLELEGEGDRK